MNEEQFGEQPEDQPQFNWDALRKDIGITREYFLCDIALSFVESNDPDAARLGALISSVASLYHMREAEPEIYQTTTTALVGKLSIALQRQGKDSSWADQYYERITE